VEPLVTRLIAAVILLASIGLACWHLRVRRGHRRGELSPAEYDFYRRQFRRRIQVSTMLGVLGVLLAIGSFVELPMVGVLLYVGMLVLVLWILLLALADAVASRAHFSRLRSDYMIERAKLEVEARRLRSAGGNGRSRGEPIGRENKDS